MKISYNKLWKVLIDKNLKKIQLQNAAKISPNTLAKLGKNEAVSLTTMKSICEALDCDISDVMEFIKEKRGNSNEEI